MSGENELLLGTGLLFCELAFDPRLGRGGFGWFGAGSRYAPEESDINAKFNIFQAEAGEAGIRIQTRSVLLPEICTC